MIDSSEQFTNDSAYFFSPVYTSNYSVDACFQFYYHMYGDSVGMLGVYIKPLTMRLEDMKKMSGHFSVNGSHGNIWNEGFFKLQPQNESFQIVFGSSLGMRFKSDIAIDDVTLLNDQQCLGTTATEENIASVDDVVYRIDSCENRCWNNGSVSSEKADLNIIHCDCFIGCIDGNSCCPDFIERCVFNLLNDNKNVVPFDIITAMSSNSTSPSEHFDVNAYTYSQDSVTNRIGVGETNVKNRSYLYLFAGCVIIIGFAIWIQRERCIALFSNVQQKVIQGTHVYTSTVEDMQFLVVHDDLNHNVSEECHCTNREQCTIPFDQVTSRE